ncbi:putative endo-1,3(4)-beta-glucanase 2-like [Capsicum annuum]|nr:putative endo-1,3(4)-beta-glucanase 2-like [Capsicum annuum]
MVIKVENVVCDLLAKEVVGCLKAVSFDCFSRGQHVVVKITIEVMAMKQHGNLGFPDGEISATSCTIASNDGAKEVFDGCIMAAHAPNTLKMLGEEATSDETRILGAFQYVYRDIANAVYLPLRKVTYVMDYCDLGLLNLGDPKLPYLVTLDPPHAPEHTLLKWTTRHPVPSAAASKASCELHQIQGKRRIWFSGAYQGYGFHENGLKAGVVAAYGMLRRNCSILDNPKQMVPTWPETGARLLVTSFFKNFIQTGCIIFMEEGGTVFTFQGTDRKCSLKVSLRIHTTQFYWRVATQADIGLADAFIHGDFSFVDKNEGLINRITIYLANTDPKAYVKTSSKKSGWWTPMLLTTALSAAKYFICHVSNQNTLTQARHNISHHYDMCEDEDLKDAQLRKINVLIGKAKISKEHHILEIGCGWGSFAVEVVKQTGCRYTGITLSEQQLKYAQLRVKQAGFQIEAEEIEQKKSREEEDVLEE